MGYVSGASLSVIPPSNRFCHRREVLQNHEQVGMATTGTLEAD